jgi:predicted dehydrogenase
MVMITHRAVTLPIRLAIIGCGAIGVKEHIPASKRAPGVQLVALIDNDGERARQFAKKFGVHIHASNIEDLRGKVDAVVIATPPQSHRALAEQAFGLGLHVLCEKPLATSSADAQAMVEAAEQAGKLLAVAHKYRFFPNREFVRNLLKQSTLGRLTEIDVEQGRRYDWPSLTGYSVRSNLASGGTLQDEGIHTLDTLFWWLGAPHTFEYADDAVGGLESNVRLKMTFEDQLAVRYRLSRTCDLSNLIVMRGEHGEVSIPLFKMTQITTRGSATVSSLKINTRTRKFAAVARKQIEDFASAITHGTAPRATGKDGLVAVKFIESCYLAKRARPLPNQAPIPGVTF